MVSGALKALSLPPTSEELGFACVPNATEAAMTSSGGDLGSAEAMMAFCKGIRPPPVGATRDPGAWAMPGYDSDVIMAPALLSRQFIDSPPTGPSAPLRRLLPGASPVRQGEILGNPAEAGGGGLVTLRKVNNALNTVI
ncbi:MAG: methionine gamma-lyase family protein [Dysosmobacter welbionis]